MANDDAGAYRRRLSEVLRRSGFGWVVDQAETHIASGRQVTKQVSERQDFKPESNPLFEVRPRRRRRASLITSEPYSDDERLEILLNAINAALVQRAELEIAVLEMLEVDSIAFRPDTEPDIEGTSLGTSHTIDAGRRNAALRIKSAADEAVKAIRHRPHDGT